MRRAWDVFRRPLLDLTRAQTEAACRAEGIDWWTDPANDDPRFTRIRVRHTVLPMLEAELGPGVAATLARTADQVRPDIEALDGGPSVSSTRSGSTTASRRPRSAGPRRPSSRGCCGSQRWQPARRPPTSSMCTSSRWRTWWPLRGGSGHGDVQLPGRVTAYRDGDLLRFRST